MLKLYIVNFNPEPIHVVIEGIKYHIPAYKEVVGKGYLKSKVQVMYERSVSWFDYGTVEEWSTPRGDGYGLTIGD